MKALQWAYLRGQLWSWESWRQCDPHETFLGGLSGSPPGKSSWRRWCKRTVWHWCALAHVWWGWSLRWSSCCRSCNWRVWIHQFLGQVKSLWPFTTKLWPFPWNYLAYPHWTIDSNCWGWSAWLCRCVVQTYLEHKKHVFRVIWMLFGAYDLTVRQYRRIPADIIDFPVQKVSQKNDKELHIFYYITTNSKVGGR